MRKLKIILLLLISCLGLGALLVSRDQESVPPKKEKIIQAGDAFYPPSRPGRICGLINATDAEKITASTGASLYEYNQSREFPINIDVEGKGISVNCLVQKNTEDNSPEISLKVEAKTLPGDGVSVDPFDYAVAYGQGFAGKSKKPERLSGTGYAGLVSATHGGYILTTCPQGGSFIVVLGTSNAELAVPGMWIEPLFRVLAEAERLGACVKADEWAPNSKRLRAAEESRRLRLAEAEAEAP